MNECSGLRLGERYKWRNIGSGLRSPRPPNYFPEQGREAGLKDRVLFVLAIYIEKRYCFFYEKR